MSSLLKANFTSEKQLIYIWIAGNQKWITLLTVSHYG